MQLELTIVEENYKIIWWVIVVVSGGFAAFLLETVFNLHEMLQTILLTIIALFLFSIAFRGIYKISETLYRFHFVIKNNNVTIQVFKGDILYDEQYLKLDDVNYLSLKPREKPSPGEALFDFSSNYYLVYKEDEDNEYKEVISSDNYSFTLRITDIGKIIQFFMTQNPYITIPEPYKSFLHFH
ncbi:MAG TPA: hypothetical protein VKA34_02805 [Balneolales bacterium]|nr:hypothetical protein [Balneolales bacterium]